MTEIISVEFKKGGRVYYFKPGKLTVVAEQWVIVETVGGESCGLVTMGNHRVSDGSINTPLKNVLRIATPEDIEIVKQNRKEERRAFRICEQKIEQHKLAMKLINVELNFARSKMMFYFTADGRVDFRVLVKELASVFRARIELRQIGVRDESKMVGGIAVCGQAFCCSRFLPNFAPVSIKMAKEQGLSLNPAKISGSCGRLMCCLGYEQEAYKHLNSITPTVGSTVKTPEGEGVIIDANVLSGNLKVKDLKQAAPRQFHRDEVVVLNSVKRGKRR